MDGSHRDSSFLGCKEDIDWMYIERYSCWSRLCKPITQISMVQRVRTDHEYAQMYLIFKPFQGISIQRSLIIHHLRTGSSAGTRHFPSYMSNQKCYKTWAWHPSQYIDVVVYNSHVHRFRATFSSHNTVYIKSYLTIYSKTLILKALFWCADFGQSRCGQGTCGMLIAEEIFSFTTAAAFLHYLLRTWFLKWHSHFTVQ